MKRILSLGAVCALLFGALSTPADASDFASSPYLVRDIIGGHFNTPIEGGVSIGSKLIFIATDGGGTTPWVSDGSRLGTQSLGELDPNCGPTDHGDIAVLNGLAYFAADNGVTGCELYATDGTPDGTQLVLNLNTTAGSSPSNPADLTVIGGSLYFAAEPTGAAPQQLYRFTPVPAGQSGPPALFKLTNNTATAGIGSITGSGGKVFFASSQGGTGFEPWAYDPTAHTVTSLGDLFPGATGSTPTGFTALGSTVYFSAEGSSADQFEVWRTNGTAGGTFEAFNINTNPSTGSNPREFFAHGDELLFRADGPGENTGLWSTDGTAVHEFYGMGGGSASSSTEWIAYKGYVYFAGRGSSGGELWRTKGGTLSTTLVKDINPGTSDSSPTGMRIVNGTLYFTARDATHGTELWKSDGTGSGTKQVKDIFTGSTGGVPNASSPTLLSTVGNTLFFTAVDAAHGRELWAYNTRSSSTKGYPKGSYSTSTDSAHKIKIEVKVRATGTTPTGTVVLKKGSTTIGTGTLSHGKVTIQLTAKLGKGTTKLRAYYLGSVLARASHSSSISVKVK